MEILVCYITGVGQTCPLPHSLFSNFTVPRLSSCFHSIATTYLNEFFWFFFFPFASWKLLSKISLNVSNWAFLLDVARCSQSIQNIAWLWLLNFFVVIWYQSVIQWIRKYFVSAVNASLIRKYAELNVQVWEKETQGFCYRNIAAVSQK